MLRFFFFFFFPSFSSLISSFFSLFDPRFLTQPVFFFESQCLVLVLVLILILVLAIGALVGALFFNYSVWPDFVICFLISMM